jgi:predicted RNA-binding protein YlxR (DUF448 family)
MTAVSRHADEKATARVRKDAESPHLRKCLATGEMKPRTELIRFVIGPDQAVVPDLAENLPGTGLWVSASADLVAQAVKKNLFAKAAQSPAKPAADLAEQTEKLLRARCLSLLGLAKGAGAAVLGEAQTEAALRAADIDLFCLQAPDAGRTLDNRRAVASCTLFSREELGDAFCFAQIVYAGLMRHGLTDKLKREIARLTGFLNIGKNEG